ncbi:hypothetical protein J4G02_23015 [Candidatus Poribacteria bacterium]|nr:hypothetical protein [Candidatus Poribacteria bacterium]
MIFTSRLVPDYQGNGISQSVPIYWGITFQAINSCKLAPLVNMGESRNVEHQWAGKTI